MNLKSKSRDWLPYLVYSLLSLAILGPLLLPGYILTLDMVFTPSLDSTDLFYGFQGRAPSFVPYFVVMDLASNIAPGWLVQKVTLFLIFLLCGLGAHRLFPFRGAGKYFAGLLYTVNPFTYIRLLAGQWTIVLAYALMPFAIRAFLDMLENLNRRNAIRVAVFFTLVGAAASHFFFLLFFVYFILFLAKVIKERKHRHAIAQAGKYVGLSAGLFIPLNLYWIIPLLSGGQAITGHITWQDMLLFAPQLGSILGIAFDTASMHGFWRGGYLYAKDIFSFWWLIFIFVIYLAVFGYISRWRDEKLGWIVNSFAAIWVISLFLAVGIAIEFTRPFFEWLFQNVPFLGGFRDSQKFVALLCLAYAYLGGLGVSEFAQRIKQEGRKLVRIGASAFVILALASPLAYSFTMFGFHGYVKTTDYPSEWYEINDYLNEDEDDFNVLFLPWHMYMDYSWLPNLDKRLAEPAHGFFDKPVIAGDNLEVPGIYSDSTNPVSKYVENLLWNARDMDNWGELLAPLNVKYVILVHEADYPVYDFLYYQEDLAVELERAGITLFRNEHPTTRVYGVDNVVYIQSTDEYLELSKTQDVMENLYIIGDGVDEVGSAGMQPIDFVRKSPVEYQVEGSSRRYTVLTVPQNTPANGWEYNGERSAWELGFRPVFEAADDGGKVVYTRFYRVYLPGYIISLAALAFVGWFYFFPLLRGSSKRQHKRSPFSEDL